MNDVRGKKRQFWSDLFKTEEDKEDDKWKSDIWLRKGDDYQETSFTEGPESASAEISDIDLIIENIESKDLKERIKRELNSIDMWEEEKKSKVEFIELKRNFVNSLRDVEPDDELDRFWDIETTFTTSEAKGFAKDKKSFFGSKR